MFHDLRLLKTIVRRSRRRRPIEATLPLAPMALLAACGGGGGGGPAAGTPAPPPVTGQSDAMTIPAGSTEATGNVLGNDTVTAGTATVTAVAVQGGATGTVGSALQGNLGQLILQANGAYTYAAGVGTSGFAALAAGQTGTETFTYTPTANGVAATPQTLTITVTGVNDAPVLAADNGGTAAAGAAVTGNVLANDSDPDRGATLIVTAVRAGTATGGTEGQGALAVLPAVTGTYGTLTMNDDGSYSYLVNADDPDTRTLGAGQSAIETFTYTVSDGTVTRTATLSFNVAGGNRAPTTVSDQFGGRPDQTVTGNLLTNDSDADGQALTLSRLQRPDGTSLPIGEAFSTSYGRLTVQADGSFSFVIDGANGEVRALPAGGQLLQSFVYTTTDGSASSSNSFNLVINGVNEAPTHFGTPFVEQNEFRAYTTRNGNFLSSFTDPDTGTVLRVVSVIRDGVNIPLGVATPSGAFTITVNADGSYSAVANTATARAAAETTVLPEIIGVTVTDGLATTEAFFRFRVRGAGPLTGTFDSTDIMRAGETRTGNILANDINPDPNAALQVTSVTRGGVNIPLGVATASGGVTLTVRSDGSYTAVADTATARAAITGGPNGVPNDPPSSELFTYTLSNGQSQATAQFQFRVQGVDDAPVMVADTSSVTASQTATGNVLTNDIEYDLSQAKRVSGLTGPTGAVVTTPTASSFRSGSDFGTLNIAENGAYSYVADGTATQRLRAGQTATETFTYSSPVPLNTPALSTTLTITITGINDATTSGTLVMPQATEGRASPVGTSLFIPVQLGGSTAQPVFDPDDRLVLAQLNALSNLTSNTSIAGEYGALVFTGAGDLRYQIDNNDADTIALAPGQRAIEYYSYRVAVSPQPRATTDGDGGPDVTGLITQTVVGDLGPANPTAPTVHVVTGGATVPTISATTGASDIIVKGSLGGATLSSSADTVVYHLDTGTLAGVIDGGGGSDTLRLVDNTGVTLTPTNLDIGARLRNFESIDLAGTGNTTLGIRVQDVLDANGDPDRLMITGTAGDRVDIDIPAWTLGTDQTIDGQFYHTYTSGGATLLVDPDILVI